MSIKSPEKISYTLNLSSNYNLDEGDDFTSIKNNNGSNISNNNYNYNNNGTNISNNTNFII